MYNVIHDVSDTIINTLSRVLEQNLLIQKIDIDIVPDTITLSDELLRTYSFKIYIDNDYSKYPFIKYSNLLYSRVMKLYNSNEIELIANELYVYVINSEDITSDNEIVPYFYEHIEPDLLELGLRRSIITDIASYYSKLVGNKDD